MNCYLTNKLNLLLTIIVFSVICPSCTKDKVPLPEIPKEIDPNQCDDCILVPKGSNGFFDQTFTDTIHYMSPQFNPNNDNEIIFIQTVPGIQKLFKLNLITKQKTLIFEGQFSGSHISWGANDWILLPLMDFQIWKIKSDGTQLSKVTSNGAWFHPEWNVSGDKFIAYHGYLPSNLYYATKILNISGTILDSIKCYKSVGDWNNTLGYGCSEVNSISVYNTSTGEVISDFEDETTKQYRSFTWISDKEALVSNVYGIYKYNIYTKSFIKLKCSCNSKIYNLESVNSDKTKVLFSLAEIRRFNNTTLLAKSTLFMMDVNGENVENISVP